MMSITDIFSSKIHSETFFVRKKLEKNIAGIFLEKLKRDFK